jgi:hypothetical protein
VILRDYCFDSSACVVSTGPSTDRQAECLLVYRRVSQVGT